MGHHPTSSCQWWQVVKARREERTIGGRLGGCPPTVRPSFLFEDEQRAAAVARINDNRDFRNHAVVYCAVNTLLVVIWAASGAGYFWPIWAIAGWGIGLAAHAWRVYGQEPISEADIIEEMHRSQNPPHRTSS